MLELHKARKKEHFIGIVTVVGAFSPLNEGQKATQTSSLSVSMQWESEEMWQITTLSFCV